MKYIFIHIYIYIYIYIFKYDDDVGAVCGCTVMCVQGVQEWAEDATLRSTSVKDQGR